MANIFLEHDILQKIRLIESTVQFAWLQRKIEIPLVPSRGPASVVPLNLHPPKKGLSFVEGRARLLHDLANIELQAMELGLRTLIEFPEAPEALRSQLSELTLSEARHLHLCLEQMKALGFEWGDWPVHTGLWDAVSANDSLIDRMFIVHRYLEGSGLDAQDTILRRLEGINDPLTLAVLKQIHREEVDHVSFGTRWHQALLPDPSQARSHDLRGRLEKLRDRLPKRIQPICHRWRLQAGFSPEEIEALEDFRKACLVSKYS